MKTSFESALKSLTIQHQNRSKIDEKIKNMREMIIRQQCFDDNSVAIILQGALKEALSAMKENYEPSEGNPERQLIQTLLGSNNLVSEIPSTLNKFFSHSTLAHSSELYATLVAYFVCFRARYYQHFELPNTKQRTLPHLHREILKRAQAITYVSRSIFNTTMQQSEPKPTDDLPFNSEVELLASILREQRASGATGILFREPFYQATKMAAQHPSTRKVLLPVLFDTVSSHEFNFFVELLNGAAPREFTIEQKEQLLFKARQIIGEEKAKEECDLPSVLGTIASCWLPSEHELAYYYFDILIDALIVDADSSIDETSDFALSILSEGPQIPYCYYSNLSDKLNQLKNSCPYAVFLCLINMETEPGNVDKAISHMHLIFKLAAQFNNPLPAARVAIHLYDFYISLDANTRTSVGDQMMLWASSNEYSDRTVEILNIWQNFERQSALLPTLQILGGESQVLDETDRLERHIDTLTPLQLSILEAHVQQRIDGLNKTNRLLLDTLSTITKSIDRRLEQLTNPEVLHENLEQNSNQEQVSSSP